MKKQLISTLITTALMASLVSPMATANDNMDDSYKVGEQEQLIGLGSGAALGAIVGGPVGAVVGAMVGGIVGTAVGQDEQIKAQDEELGELLARNTELERISRKYNQAQIEIARLEQEKYELMNLEDRQLDLALEMNVHFRTGSAEIEPLFKVQLDEIAEIMKQAPDIRWELSGYSDRRGSSERNLALSEQRVEAVRQYLELQGVDTLQLFASAYGDQAPLKGEQNFEGDFFDRRVTLRSASDNVTTAKNH
ncbi:cell envelope biogenesis protein OmpA [Photobacterium gaetbulicola]|uniref:OmpA family protein n=2 Tax=Photobacterium gaetbulicola TaxID=1295392 RepID=A0A0C5WS30_9GAMM|nr:sortase-associated OmpA-like protein PdsO [Photobacterium gaetbulicola]AJR05755.1 OmpA family protein [Photobacterium gaetbulicola Gung47]KHT62202.1 cell envelope biogenesis protein OmpA [Photobacterium gaetbulicola]PSU14721.1 cell envelope biogenesis protein OmpA [Photobacterium gaetbulicola]